MSRAAAAAASNSSAISSASSGSKSSGSISASPAQVAAATGLLDGGATVPFVARYRKEVTGGLDDTQLRNLAERLSYLRELEARRAAILESIRGRAS
jgi:uncharacterized protein